jgi:putative heme-binding domain-containing protein
MYREVIEDYSAIPRYLQQQYVESLRNGRDKGRIWRILPEGKPANRGSILGGAPVVALVAELGSPNAWRRLTAQRLLVERRDKTIVPALEELAVMGSTPHARLHALHTLDGLESLQPEVVVAALADAHHGVRLAALQLAERWLDKAPAVLAAALKLTQDRHAKVRLQLAFTLGESKDGQVVPSLAQLAQSDGQEPWMQTAILSSVADRSGQLAEILVHSDRTRTGQLLRSLAAVVGARNQDGELSRLLELAANLTGDHADGVKLTLLSGLADGLGRNPSKKPISRAGQMALERLVQSPLGEARTKALQVAGLVGLRDSAVIREFRSAAISTALDEKKSLHERLAALTALDRTPTAQLSPVQQLLDARQAPDLQLAAIQLFASDDGPEVVGLLLRNWQRSSPRTQAAILDAICSRKDRLPLLLDAIENKTVEAASLSALRQTQLLENPDAAIGRRARALLATRITDDRRQVLEKYQAALTRPRDIGKGREVYEKQCMKCHQLKGQGFLVGPDLAAAQNRPDESLLVDILDPSAAITVGFKVYTVATRNGKIYTGVMAAESATSVTLRRDQGAEDTVLRMDIDEIQTSSKSLMPEGLEKEITVQEMANLIGYLRDRLRSRPR